MATLFNTNSAVLTQLRRALESSGDGAALNPYDLDPVLKEELYKLMPLTELMATLQAGGKTHEYSVRSSHPLGWFETEVTPANAANSVYARASVQTKILRTWGSVTGYAQVVDDPFIDALATEITGSMEGIANALEYALIWGAANDGDFTGDAKQFTGMVPRIFDDAATNVVDAGGNKITLADLDEALALSANFRGVQGDPKVWLMGTRMRQVVDGLQSAVQIPLTQVELNDGKIRMAAYDYIPIYQTDFVAPASTSTSPTDLAAVEDDGAGSLAADQYFYNISSVTYYGEQIAGTEANVTTVGGGDAVDLSWTGDTNARLYFIWRGLATGNANLQLLDVIAAKTYDATTGAVTGLVESYKDTGAKTPVAVKPLSTGEQNIILANLNPQRGAAIVGLVDDMGRRVDNLFNYVELARVKDTYDYMIKGYLAERIVHPNLLAVVRHAKLA